MVSGFFLSTTVHAQTSGVRREDVGPEVAGAGYIRIAQEDLYRNLIQPQQYTGVVQIANALSEPAYNPVPSPADRKIVIRVVDFGPTTPDNVFISYAQSLLANKSAFPQGTIVYLGNELNNLTLEYKGLSDTRAAGLRYSQQFKVFASAIGNDSYFRVAPAPPDLYNGDWDPTPWIEAFRNSGACAGVDVLVANVFDGIPTRAGTNPGLDAWKILETSMCPGKKVVHFGGIGVNPNTQPPPSIQSQVDFLNTVQLPPGVSTATTLIIDTCKNSNVTKRDWLFYVYGKAYDSTGAEVLNDCSRNQAQTYIYPGVDDQAGLPQRYDMLSRYTLTCGTFHTITGTIKNEDLANRPDEQFAWDNYYDPPGAAGISIPCPGQVGVDDNRCVLKPILADVYFDDREATIPLFRLETAQVPSPLNESRRLEDLEGFFSAPFSGGKGSSTTASDVFSDADSRARTLSNGVARKLDPKVTWCRNTVQFLKSIKQLCEMPRNSPVPINNTQLSTPKPGVKCALDQDIPTTGLSYLDIASSISETFDCTKPENSLSDSMLKAFLAVEPTIHSAFKPAYIVRYLDTPGPFDSAHRVGPFSRYLNWFAPGIDNAEDGIDFSKRFEILDDRISLTKVYVPAGFAENITSRPNTGDRSLDFPTFRSGFMQSMQALFTRKEQEKIEDVKQDDIDIVRQRVASDAFNAPNPDDKHYIDCRECLPATQDAVGDDAVIALKSMIVRRINAELYEPTATMNQHCSAISGSRATMVGEQSDLITQSINPAGTYDPVTQVTQLNVGAGIRWKAAREPHDEAHIKTFFLLPEEYRNVQNYEQLLLERYMPTRSNERFFPATAADRQEATRKYLLEGKRFLMLSGVTTQLQKDINSNTGGPVIGRELSRQTVITSPGPVQSGPPAEYEGLGAEKRLEGELNLADEGANVNPQVPGGKLERTLVEILCNITRPITLGSDGQLHPTAVDVKRPRLGAVMTKGLAACTEGASPITDPGQTGNLACSGQTQVPPNSDWTAFYAIFQRVANQTGIPANILYGVFRLEGTPTYQAVYDGRSSVGCSANRVGAVGPMGILVSACGGRFDNWERYSAQAGVSGSACDLEASLTVGATILKTFYNSPSQSNCAPNYPTLSAEQKRWVDAAASYNGSCTPLQSGMGCDYQGKNLTYGECAVIKFAPTYGRSGG